MVKYKVHGHEHEFDQIVENQGEESKASSSEESKHREEEKSKGRMNYFGVFEFHQYPAFESILV